MPDYQAPETTYDQNTMAAALLPVYNDPSFAADPEGAVKQFKDVYDSGQGQWTPEAKKYFSDKLANLQRQGGIEYDTSWLDKYAPPAADPKLPKEENVKALDTWKDSLLSDLDKNSGSDWLIVKDQAEAAINERHLNARRALNEEDTGRVTDFIDRSLNAAASFGTSMLGVAEVLPGGEGAAEWAGNKAEQARNYFETNPKYDTSTVAKIADTVGSMGPLMVVPGIAGAVAGVASGNLAVGYGTMEALGAFMAGSSAYTDTYNTILRKTGSNQTAHSAAIARGIGEAGIMAITNRFIGAGVLEPWVAGLDTAGRREALAELFSESAIPIIDRSASWTVDKTAAKGVLDRIATERVEPSVLRATAEGATVGIPSMAAMSGASSIARQGIEGTATGEPINYQDAWDATKEGAITGFLLGGVTSGGSSGLRALTKRADEIAKTDTNLLARKPPTDKTPPTEGNVTLNTEQTDFEPVIVSNEPGTPVELPRLNETEQRGLASKLTRFLKDGDAKELTLENIKPSQIPEDLIATLENTYPHWDWEVKESPTGSQIVKTNWKEPVRATVIPNENEQKVSPEVVENKRVEVIPTKIQEKAVQLQNIRTDAQVNRDIEVTGRALQLAIRTYDSAPNNLKPTLVRGIDTLGKKLKGLLTELATPRKRSVRRAQLTNDIKELQLEHQTASDIIKQKVEIPPIKPAATRKTDKTKAKEPQTTFLQRSRSTGATFTPKIDSALRNSLNYLIGGYGLRGIHVTTFEELEAGTFKGTLHPEQKKLIARIKKEGALTGAGGIMLSNRSGMHGIIALKDGSASNDAFLKATHEFGHAVAFDFLKNAPEEVKMSVAKEFSDAVEKIKTNKKITLAEAADVMQGPRTPNNPFNSDLLFRKAPKRLKAGGEGASQDYLVGSDKNPMDGFQEFFANRVSKWAHQLSEQPNSPAEKLYKGIAENYLRAWRSLAGRFADSPTLETWLNEQWNDQRAVDMFYPKGNAPSSKAEAYLKAAEEEGNIRQTAASKRVAEAPEKSTVSPEVKERFGDNWYEQQAGGPIRVEAFNAIRREGFDEIFRQVHDGDVSDKKAGHYLGQLLVEAERLERTANTPKEKALALSRVLAVWDDIESKGNTGGQFIESLKYIAERTQAGRIKWVTEKLWDRMKKAIPASEWEKIHTAVKDGVQKYWEAESKAPTGIFREKVLRAEMDYIHKSLGSPSTPGLMWKYWYGDILSGLSTHFVNFEFSALDALAKAAATAAAFPRDIGELVKGIASGFKKGRIESVAALKGLPITHPGRTRTEDFVTVTPHVNWKGTPYAALEKPVNLLLALQQKWPFQTLLATDSFYRRMGTEMQSRVVAAERIRNFFQDAVTDKQKSLKRELTPEERTSLLQSSAKNRLGREATAREIEKGDLEISGKELATLVSETMHDSSDEWQSALEQARKEHDSLKDSIAKEEEELNKKRDPTTPEIKIPFEAPSQKLLEARALEIIDERIKASMPEVYAEANRAGSLLNLTNDPEGSAKVVADVIKTIVQGVPASRFMFPFVNVAVNIMSRMVDYTPFGVVRGMKGHNIFNYKTENVPVLENGVAKKDSFGRPLMQKKPILWSEVEARQRLVTGIGGTVALAGISALASEFLDDKNPKFAIYGAGPKNKAQMENWLSEGHIPYSIEMNGKAFKYAEWPAAFIFGWMGSYGDAYRWDKSFNRKSPGAAWLTSGLMAFKTMEDLSVINNIKQAVEVVQGTRSPGNLAASTLKGFIPFQGAMRDLAKYTDPTRTDPKSTISGLVSGVPFVQGWLGKPDLNGFGEEIQKAPRFWSSATKDKAWNFLQENGLHLPGMADTVTIGEGEGHLKPVYGALLEDRKKQFGRFAFNVMTDKEAYEVQQISGPRIKKVIESLSVAGKVAQPEAYQKYIDRIVSKERAVAKIQVLYQTYKTHKNNPDAAE